MSRTLTVDGQLYELPPNLYAHCREVKGKWRYKGEDDKSPKDLNKFLAPESQRSFFTPEEAIAIAINLNGGTQPERRVTHLEKKVIAELEAFEEKEVLRRIEAGKHDRRAFLEEINWLKKFVRQYFEKIDYLDPIELENWWYAKNTFRGKQYEKTYHSQRRQRHIFRLFFDHLSLHNLWDKHYDILRIFVLKKNVGKKRRRMKIGELLHLVDMARKEGQHHIAVGALLGLYTGLRRGNVISLRFDDIVDGHLTAKSLKGDLREENNAFDNEDAGNWIEIPLKEHKLLLGVINEARQSANCPEVMRKNQGAARHIVHRVGGRKNSWKEHHTQVSGQEFCRHFTDLVRRSGLYKGYSEDEMPSFHEIRALYAHVLKKNDVPLEVAQKQLVHKTQGQTEHYMADHERNVTRIEVPITDDMIERVLAYE